jgi:hypothetical protein
VLFCIYIDSLLLSLKSSGSGCFIGEVFLGALGYADDIALLAPTPRAMRAMLSVCDEFATRFHVVFNAKKSKCLHIAPRGRSTLSSNLKPNFFIGGNSIDYVDDWAHLGHTISAACDDKTEITNKRNSLCGQINNVICFFGKRDPITKLALIKAYSTSFYGSVLWDLSHASIEDFCAVWRKGLRRVWGLPYNAHSVLLSPLCGCLPLMDELACRSAVFITCCLKSDCDIVNYVARHGLSHARMLSPIGRNAAFCCSRFDVSFDDITVITKRRVWSHAWSQLSLEVFDTVSVLLELLFVKFNFYSLSSSFTSSDVDVAIACLCTM